MLYLLFGLMLLVFMGILVGGESYRPVQSRPLAPVRQNRPLARESESRPVATRSESKPPLVQTPRYEVKRPMKFRPLRIAWSAVCFVACYLLSALWAMTFLPGRGQTAETALQLDVAYACGILSVAVLGIMPWTGWRFRLIATTMLAAVLGLAVYAAKNGFPAIHY
jgi:hypothetical protein